MEKEFYYALSEINFIDTYFHNKYLLSLQDDTAYHLETKKTTKLPIFYKKYPIKRILKQDFSIHTKDNIIIIKRNENQFLVLETIHYLKSKNKYQLPNDAFPLFKEESIYASTKGNLFLIYFNLYTNIDISKQSNYDYLLNILRECIFDLGSYFYKESENNYYLYIHDINELEVLDLMIQIKEKLSSNATFYINPSFHYTKLPMKNIVLQSMESLKLVAKEKVYDEKQFIHYIPYEVLKTV